MNSDDEFEDHFKSNEPPEHWRLRKMFLKKFKDRLADDELQVNAHTIFCLCL